MRRNESDSFGHRAFLGLGGNLGDPLANLRQARRALQQESGISVTAASPLYRTDPVGGPPGQPDYLNAVLAIATRLEPAALLQRCLAIEAACGRSRQQRWEARTLDIDLLLYDDRVMDTATLQLPHPRLAERGFVLVPLCDLAPELRHPVTGQSFTTLLQSISPVQGVHRLDDLW